VDISLRNLKILFLAGTSTNGINMTDGNSLTVEGCVVTGFSDSANSKGIYVNTPASVTVVDSLIRSNYNGIVFDNGATGNVSRTTVVENVYAGIWAHPLASSTVTVTVSDSVSSSNTYGFAVSGSTNKFGSLSVSRSTAANNSAYGFGTSSTSSPSNSTITVSDSSASGNLYGFFNVSATFQSLGNNAVSKNTTDTTGVISVIAFK
jgi:hypothetical protein